MSSFKSIKMNFDMTSIYDIYGHMASNPKGKIQSLMLWLIPCILHFAYRYYILSAAELTAVDRKRYTSPQRSVVDLGCSKGTRVLPVVVPDETGCSICREAISSPQTVVAHVQYRNPFHQDCLFQWLTKVGRRVADCLISQIFLVNEIEDIQLGICHWNTKRLLEFSVHASFVSALFFVVFVLSTFGLTRIERQYIRSESFSTALKDFTFFHGHWILLCLLIAAVKLAEEIKAKNRI
jgi:hypothetical protein